MNLPMSELLLGDRGIVRGKAVKDEGGTEDDGGYDTGEGFGACQEKGTEGGHEGGGKWGREEGCGDKGGAEEGAGAFADGVEMHGLLFAGDDDLGDRVDRLRSWRG